MVAGADVAVEFQPFALSALADLESSHRHRHRHASESRYHLIGRLTYLLKEYIAIFLILGIS